MDQWISAADALGLVASGRGELEAMKLMCSAANSGGLVPTAEVLIIGGKSFRNRQVPRDLWWLPIYDRDSWTSGTFETVVRGRHKIEVQGVRFSKGDVERI